MNKVISGDCYEELQKLPDESVDLILTDPPYGIGFVPQRKNSSEKHHSIPIANDELLGEDWVNWFIPIAQQLFRVLKRDSVAYFFSGFNPIYYYYSLTNAGFSIKASLIWVKNSFGMGYHFRRQYECIIVAFKGRPGVPEKAISDVLFAKKINGGELLHSCQKPTELLRMLIKQYSREGDLVLDPFVGSGSTLVAAKSLNRRFLGFEVDDKYVRIATNRLRQKNLYEVLESEKTGTTDRMAEKQGEGHFTRVILGLS